MPVLTLVDTPGAYPGLGAEERGQAEAIAVNLREMARLEVPIVTVVIGEGGSGGALAIAVADVVLMLENSIYSVISPEGCASILWRDGKKAPQAAEALRAHRHRPRRSGHRRHPARAGGGRPPRPDAAAARSSRAAPAPRRLLGVSRIRSVEHRLQQVPRAWGCSERGRAPLTRVTQSLARLRELFFERRCDSILATHRTPAESESRDLEDTAWR